MSLSQHSPANDAAHRDTPARVAGIYLLFSLVWIWLSDFALNRLGIEGELGFWAAAAKGSVFVLFSAGILYWVVRREVRALSRAIGLLRAVTDETTDAVFVKDHAGKYLFFNEAAARFVGKPVAEVLGRDDTEVFDSESAATVMARDRQVMESGHAETQEEELTAGGVTRTYLATKAPYRDATGNVIGIIGISRDVTERKRAEGELRASQEQYEQLVATIDGVVWEADVRTFQFTFVSRQAERLSGYPIERWRTEKDFWANQIHRDDRDWAVNYCLTATRARKNHDFEYRMLAADGRVIWVRDIVTLVIENGEATKMRGIMIDITAQKQAASLVASQNAILERITTGAPLAEVLAEIVRMVEDQLPGVIASILLLDREGRRLRLGAAPNLPPEYNAAIDGIEIGPTVGSCGTAAYLRKAVNVASIATDPLWANYKHLALVHGLRACWSTPIFATPRSGAQQPVLGAFAVYGRQQGDPGARFAELIARAEHLACIAIESDRAARDLRESEERYRSLVESSADAIFVNEGGRIVYANPALLRLIGASSADQVLGTSPLDITHPDYHGLVKNRIQALTDGRRPVPFVEQKFLRLDGTAVDVEVAGVPFERKGGVAIHVTAREITERKLAERALREREEQLRIFVDHVWAPIAMFDRNMRYIHISRRWLSDYRLGERNIIGRSHYEVFPEIPERWKAIHRRCLAGAVEWCEEDRFERADGSVQWLRWEIQPWRQADGGVGGIVMFTEDITARKRMETQLQQSQKMEAVGRLAGGIAHDFNNLLTVINGFSDFILRDTAPDDPNRDALTHIRTAGDRAARLTHQLLAYSRQAIVEPKVLDLNELVTESTKLLRRLIGEHISVVTSLQPALVRIKVDRGQIEQVLLNLMVNARDAMSAGGRITIETRNVALSREQLPDDPDLQPGQYAQLRVSDTGSGMTEEVKAKIFEPFFTTKEQGKGTGLGLAVVHGAVKQNGGHISVTSELGVGTVFTVIFPCVDDLPAPLSTFLKRAPRGTETILLVEDEEAVRTLARIGLENQGYTILAADSGAEALRKAEAHGKPIDLLITDVVMPQMSGRQLAEALRARQPNLRVLYMSGYTDDVFVRHGLADATDEFLQKPFTPVSLARKVREILDTGE